jgi:phage repressor protein C with HTH and peptisase S24 domain
MSQSTRKIRLQELRFKASLSQEGAAEKIGIKRETLAGYEWHEKRKIPFPILEKMAKVYNTTIEYIESGNLIAEDKLNKMPPRVIVTDMAGQEKILFVPVKVQAGYRKHVQDPLFLKDLQAYSLPGFTNGTYRIFEVEGESMKPTIHPGDMLVCKHVEKLADIVDGKIYVVVTTEGVCVKRLTNAISKRGSIITESDNSEYKPDAIPVNEILEVWEYKMRLTSN